MSPHQTSSSLSGWRTIRLSFGVRPVFSPEYEISAPEDAPPGAEQAFITQTAFFEPKGLFGLLYWYALYVPHRFIFTGMIEELGRRAELFQRHAARQNGSADAPLPDLTPELLAKLVER